MSVLTVTPEFLYPHSRQFPFDEVVEKIVRAMEKRNWKVPGITVEFRTYGSGEAKYQMANCITGKDFQLYFCRAQGKLCGTWIDNAAVSRVCIPKQSIEVYEDESGPRYYLYVGKDWEGDKEWFMNSLKIHAKLRDEPRKYLVYLGNRHKGRPIELVADDDIRREYSPKYNEPKRINLSRKFDEITKWLDEFVLQYILSFEEASVIRPPVTMEELISYEGPWNTIYSICNFRDAQRILIGKKNPKDLSPEMRHAYIGSGCRLVPLYVHDENKFLSLAYEGFIWCDPKEQPEIVEYSEISEEVKRTMKSSFGKNYIVAIKLKYANSVYVVDNSKYEETREHLFEVIFPRERLSDEELGLAFSARAETIVPINEYNGGYKEPIVIIGRELDFEEVEKIILVEEK